ncbi:MAG: 6,7-dimethyl-8-ribityllumazine synthase [Actinobacteria bacterium]|nr:MAG: 6,7-dimethyl-8-ribityllumazine synthase [Actinomycetota bacterium]
MGSPRANPAAPGNGAEEAAGLSDHERERLGRSEFAICVATFYEELAERLLNGAVEGFSAGGVSAASVHTFETPGAFELPLAAKWCAESDRFAGVACLVPCSFGVITCDTMEQALARSGGDKRDQGRNAAVAVMRMALIREDLAQ